MKILIIITLFISASFAQTSNVNKIIEGVKNKFEQVNDYKVDLTIEVDMEFLRIPKVSSTVYFKKPNKMKMDSKDFAILPKEGINFSPINMLNDNYTAIFIRQDTLDKINVDVVKIIPNNDSSNIILTTLWIDSKNNVIKKVETTTKRRGTLVAILFYDNMIKFGLPSRIDFSFMIENPKLPEMLKMDAGGIKKPLGKISKNLSGNIKVSYFNYQVNNGIDDSIFVKQKE